MPKSIASASPPVTKSAILQSWEGLLWLERRPTRTGTPGLYIRATLGTLPAWRIGPIADLAEAERLFAEIVECLDGGLEDLLLDAMTLSGYFVSKEE